MIDLEHLTASERERLIRAAEHTSRRRGQQAAVLRRQIKVLNDQLHEVESDRDAADNAIEHLRTL